jgi:hypothetical protein
MSTTVSNQLYGATTTTERTVHRRSPKLPDCLHITTTHSYLVPPNFDPTSLENPTPVFDTTNLAKIALLDQLDYAPGEQTATSDLLASTTHPHWELLAARRSYRTWVDQARTLAARGVQPGPSHRDYPDKLVPAWGAFVDTASVIAQYVENGDMFSSDPLVIYGCAVSSDDADLDDLREFPQGYHWRAFTHQAGGMSCHHPRFIGIVLEVKPSALGSLYRLSGFPERNGHNCVGIGGLGLTELAEYHEMLCDLGFDAEHTWTHLEEGVYPLDEKSAATLSDTPIPSHQTLWPQPQPDDPASQRFGWFAEVAAARLQWGVFVLGPNCD